MSTECENTNYENKKTPSGGPSLRIKAAQCLEQNPGAIATWNDRSKQLDNDPADEKQEACISKHHQDGHKNDRAHAQMRACTCTDM